MRVLQGVATHHQAHAADQVVLDRGDLRHRHQAQGQQRNKRVENRHRQPHVAQGQAKDPGALLLHVIGGTLKAAYPQHGGGKTQEQSLGPIAFLPEGRQVQRPMGGKVAADQNPHHQQSQGGQVQDKDGQGHPGRIADAQ